MADGLNVKDMKLYSEAQSIEADLAALGHGPDKPFDVSVLWTFDQLHYHGVDSVQHAIDLLPIQADESVLEVGAGWGGPSRYIAASAKADVTALELQEDFHTVGQNLTAQAGLADRVTHRLGDFLTEDFGEARFDHLVSWNVPTRSKGTLLSITEQYGLDELRRSSIGAKVTNLAIRGRSPADGAVLERLVKHC